MIIIYPLTFNSKHTVFSLLTAATLYPQCVHVAEQIQCDYYIFPQSCMTKDLTLTTLYIHIENGFQNSLAPVMHSD